MIHTWLVALGVLLELAHEVIKLLLPLLSVRETLLLQVWVVLLEELFLCRREVVCQRRPAHNYGTAAVMDGQLPCSRSSESVVGR